MSNAFDLTEEQKEAFFQVVEKLNDEIYPPTGEKSYPIEQLKVEIDRKEQLEELIKTMENNNVFTRIAKEIKSSQDLKRTVKELIEFYNNSENKKIWKKECSDARTAEQTQPM